MASKGQKFKSYSADLKQTILKKYFDGIGTPKTLSLKYDVPYRTIKNWIAKLDMISMSWLIIERVRTVDQNQGI